jgi:FKBP-type peptidyl-prolyl cis-trans isomerase FkpA
MIVAAGLVFATAGLLGCGDGITAIEDTEFAASLGINLAAMTRTSSGLYYQDIETGEGEPATSGDAVEVAYTGWLSDGTQFDSGSLTFTLGAGRVVAGFDEGVQGMRVGGVRRIVIPPALGYGSQARGAIPPDSILVFRIEVLSIG